MKRKRWIAMLLAGMMTVGMLSGCGGTTVDDKTTEAPAQGTTEAPGKETTEAPDPGTEGTESTEEVKLPEITEDIEIQFWYNGKANTSFYDEIVAEFNAQSEHVKVVATCIGNYDAIKSQLTAAHQAKTGLPAIAAMNFPAIPTYLNSGVLTDLTPYVEAWDFAMDDIVDGLVGQVTVNGKIGAIPWGPSATVHHYNKSELAKHGLDKFPETWDEFKTWCKKVYEATGVVAHTFNSGSANALSAFLMNFGGNVLDENDPTKTKLNNEHLISRLKEWKELVDAGYVNWSMEGGDLVRSSFCAGETMSYAESCQQYEENIIAVNEYPEEERFEVGVAWNWGDVMQCTTVAGASLVVPQEISEEEKNAAMYFIKWLVSPEIQKRWAKFSSYLLIHKSNINDAAVMEEICEALPEMRNVYPHVLEDYVMKPQTDYYDAVMKEFATTLQRIYIENADFDSTYAEMIENVEYILGGN